MHDEQKQIIGKKEKSKNKRQYSSPSVHIRSCGLLLNQNGKKSLDKLTETCYPRCIFYCIEIFCTLIKPILLHCILYYAVEIDDTQNFQMTCE